VGAVISPRIVKAVRGHRLFSLKMELKASIGNPTDSPSEPRFCLSFAGAFGKVFGARFASRSPTGIISLF
jgi:hypothetical protein